MTEERMDSRIADAFRDLERTGAAERDWTPEEVFDAVHGGLSRERLIELVDRSVDDPELADAFRMAQAVQVAGEGVESDSERLPGRGRRPGRMRVVATLATAAAALIAVVFLSARDGAVQPHTSEVRSGQAYEIAVESGSELPRNAFRLSWTAGPPDTRYFVEAMDSELNVLFTRRGVTTGSVTVPEEALAGIAAGGQVIWRVEAYLEDGRTVRSAAFRATVVD